MNRRRLKKSISPSSKAAALSTKSHENKTDEVRFWQGVALSLAIFALGILVSIVLGLGFLLLSLE